MNWSLLKVIPDAQRLLRQRRCRRQSPRPRPASAVRRPARCAAQHDSLRARPARPAGARASRAALAFVQAALHLGLRVGRQPRAFERHEHHVAGLHRLPFLTWPLHHRPGFGGTRRISPRSAPARRRRCAPNAGGSTKERQHRQRHARRRWSVARPATAGARAARGPAMTPVAPPDQLEQGAGHAPTTRQRQLDRDARHRRLVRRAGQRKDNQAGPRTSWQAIKPTANQGAKVHAASPPDLFEKAAQTRTPKRLTSRLRPGGLRLRSPRVQHNRLRGAQGFGVPGTTGRAADDGRRFGSASWSISGVNQCRAAR